VTIITGLNGSGKSIIIDAIRAALSGQKPDRHIVADNNDFKIEMSLNYDGTFKTMDTHVFSNGNIQSINPFELGQYFQIGYKLPGKVYEWVVNYWSSKLPTDSFELETLNSIKIEEVLKGVLQGKKSNVELTNFICQIDYLRTSEVPEEKEIGEIMYKSLRR